MLTSYLCQEARLKGALSLIVSVVVADIVLLSSGWTVLTVVSAYLAKKRNHDGIPLSAFSLPLFTLAPSLAGADGSEFLCLCNMFRWDCT